ncbi:MAG TPA: 16S rRNA (uracil(1498)-N(3))-methyltransferase [Chitinophagales bacterium]|nr:16S rRNA (uracil(1498)-N(3))-methyltransferase [Chitinophagales bacterium]
MQLFYAPDVLNGQYVLPPDEAHHCIHVLRHKTGDTIELIDGQGNFYHATIANAHPKNCTFTVQSVTPSLSEPAVNIHLAVAPTKNIERWEWMLEKITELGITHITPILTRRTERQHLRLDRLQKVILSAVKQSLKARLPVLNNPIPYDSFIIGQNQFTFPQQNFIGVIDNQHKHLLSAYQKGGNALLLIGPEGDFTPEEITLALSHHFEPVWLGRSRLRTETAAIAGCHIVNMLNEI